MKEVYFGVYVKEFVLFYGEKLQYYITEEQENQEQLTESGILQKEESKATSPQIQIKKKRADERNAFCVFSVLSLCLIFSVPFW